MEAAAVHADGLSSNHGIRFAVLDQEIHPRCDSWEIHNPPDNTIWPPIWFAACAAPAPALCTHVRVTL
jgi:hypothetical protein